MQPRAPPRRRKHVRLSQKPSYRQSDPIPTQLERTLDQISDPSRTESIIFSSESSVLQPSWPAPEATIPTTSHFAGEAEDDFLREQDFWNQELLGEESLWAQLPIFSTNGGGADLTIFENSSLTTANLLNRQHGISSASAPPLGSSPGRGQSSLGGSFGFVELAPSRSALTLDNNQQSPVSNISFSDIAPSEVVLLRHFVDFAVPPILVGVEPRWNLARNVLFRVAKSSPLVRHAICSFSSLSLSEAKRDGLSGKNQSSMHFYNLALSELQEAMEKNESPDSNTAKLENEHILASIFFLSYVELTTSSRPIHTLELLRRAHGISKINNASIKTPLGNQLRIWLKLLDAKVVSAGGEGIHLSNHSELKDFEGPAEGSATSEHTPGSGIDDQITDRTEDALQIKSNAEDILFNCINHSAYNFYVQTLDFAGRIAHLDRWHRPRGSVADELEVMTAAEQIVKDLDALWARRPEILDFAAQDNEVLGKYLSPRITNNVESHLRTYVANFYACFVHIQRAAYPYLDTTAKTSLAVQRIIALVRLCSRQGDLARLSVSMLWPLMMAGCEVGDVETREWLISVVDGMSERIGNAARTARLIREICRRQSERGQRADARTVMQEIFGTIFAII